MLSQIGLKSNTLFIDGELTIFRTQKLKSELSTALNDHDDLIVNLSSVTKIDAAGIQLLLLAKKQAAMHGKKITLKAHNASVREVIEIISLINWFN